MKMLSAIRFGDAVIFLNEQGRPLDAALHHCAFSEGDAGAGAELLARFQNEDGGYGHGLEPDAVVPVSSVLDTTHALQIAERLHLSADHPQVGKAMAYLRTTYDDRCGGWPIRPYASAKTVCAPWWKSENQQSWQTKMQEGRLNPTAEVLGYFLRYGVAQDRGLIEKVVANVGRWIEQAKEPLKNHELLCLARLTRAPKLSDELREAWVSRISWDVADRVETDPACWDRYGLKPWWIAETPGDARLRGLEPGLIEAMLDHEIGRQEPGGGWPPFWDWAGLHPEAWPAARLAWKSVLTEQMLRVLRGFRRLPGERPS